MLQDDKTPISGDGVVEPAEAREDQAPEQEAPKAKAKVEKESKAEPASREEALGDVWDKFQAEKNGESQGDDEPEAKAEADDDTDDGDDDAPAKADDGPEAPQTWPKAMRDKWAKLDPEDREFFARREAQMHGQFSQMGRQIAQAKPIVETIGQFRDVFEKNKVAPDQGIAALLTAQRALDERPVESLLNLAESYGVLDQIRQYFGGQQDEYGLPPDPEISALKSELTQLRNALAQRDQMEAAQRQAAVRQQQERVHGQYVGLVERLAQNSPDFELVSHEVVGLIPIIKAQNPGMHPEDVFKQAYERAVWANPEARKRQLAREDKAKAAAAQEAAKKATAAGSINVRGAAKPNAQADLRSVQERIWDRLNT